MTSAQLYAAALAAIAASLPLVADAQDATTSVSEAQTLRAPAAFQLSLWDSVQIVDRTRPIHGLRLALPYGRNWDVKGVDIGIVNRTDHDLVGAQFAFVGLVGGQLQGLQYNWLVSSVAGKTEGAQFAAVNTTGALEGAQFGAVNYARDGAMGASFGLVNVAEGPSEGLELGLVNYASRFEGVQFGIVNVTEHLHGVQIGLVNVARNGFVPVFVIFNAAL
jgi:hypothetical protein